MTILSRSLVAIALVLCATTVGATDAQTVLGRMRQAVEPAATMSARFEFEMTNPKSESVRWTGAYYRRGGDTARARWAFDSPLDLRGTEVATSRATDGAITTRLYIPALRRIREIKGDTRGESFLGTDFNFEDIGLEPLVDKRVVLEGESTIDGRSCYRVSAVPERGWWYGRIVRFIDEKNYLPLRTEYYDHSDTLWKVRTFGHVHAIGGHPTAGEIAMRTVPDGTSTTTTLSEVRYDTNLPEAVFEIP